MFWLHTLVRCCLCFTCSCGCNCRPRCQQPPPAAAIRSKHWWPCGHVRDWLLGTRPGEFVSMGVITVQNNSYGIVPGLVYSFPVQCSNGSWSIVEGEWAQIIS